MHSTFTSTLSLIRESSGLASHSNGVRYPSSTRPSLALVARMVKSVQCGSHVLILCGKIPGKCPSTPVFLHGEDHGQRSLVTYTSLDLMSQFPQWLTMWLNIALFENFGLQIFIQRFEDLVPFIEYLFLTSFTG